MPSRFCSRRCASTGSRSRGTRPPRSTNGWRSHIGGSATTTLAAADAATAQSIYDQLGVEPAGICGSASPAGLTKRELEILTAIAGGATNRQVAQQIFISEKTVAPAPGQHLRQARGVVPHRRGGLGAPHNLLK